MKISVWLSDLIILWFEAIEWGTLLQVTILLRTLGEVKLYVKDLIILVVIISTYTLNQLCYIGRKKLFILFIIFIAKTMQQCDNILQKI